ncbi:amidohydrolase family protein [Aliidiomarina quisquiliarum]|uniref:amidohydrolase family protein n=1 Tax=Aliidiomarina quisquiliarum TaxID=2938947 RepID=UPI00208FE8E4|nr:amidohydrolase family protein [Aliidiomarina quisquiliarum]MCO4320111.1 amidohydrolase family protein [Aliidiomarina quisquiliarum]
MKGFLGLLLFLVALPIQAHNIAPGAEAKQAILLQGGTLHTVSHGSLEQTDLLIVDGKIAAMGKELTVPANAQIINVSGQHVYPGLIALDTTLGLIELEQARPTNDMREVGTVTPEVLAHHAFNADSDIIPTIRYMGITHAQTVPQGNLVNGRSSLMQLDGWNWRDALEVGPVALHVSWPRIGLNSAWWERRTPAEQHKANAEAYQELLQVFVMAKAYHEGRLEGTQTRVDQRWEAMRGLFTGDLQLFVHADDRRQLEQALQFNREYGFAMTFVGARDSWMMADTLAELKTPVIFGYPYGLPSRVDDGYDTAYATPAMLHAAGVDFAIAYPGYWDSRNLAFGAGNAVAYGLDYQAALRAITLTPARFMGVDKSLGSLDVGKQATLIVSAGDVLDHLGQRIEYMFIDGREVNLSNRQLQLYEKYSERPNN